MSNTIRYGDLFTKWVIPFWDDNMPPRRFRASKKYKSIHSWSSFVPEKSLAYSWMRFVGDLKFGSLAALLRAAGQRQPAEALWRGWRYLCLYNDERLDFGLFFCVRNVEAVEEVMAESMAPWTPGAKAYERRRAVAGGAGGGRCCGAGGCATAAAGAGGATGPVPSRLSAAARVHILCACCCAVSHRASIFRHDGQRLANWSLRKYPAWVLQVGSKPACARK